MATTMVLTQTRHLHRRITDMSHTYFKHTITALLRTRIHWHHDIYIFLTYIYNIICVPFNDALELLLDGMVWYLGFVTFLPLDGVVLPLDGVGMSMTTWRSGGVFLWSLLFLVGYHTNVLFVHIVCSHNVRCLLMLCILTMSVGNTRRRKLIRMHRRNSILLKLVGLRYTIC